LLPLEELVLEGHVGLGLKTNAGAEDVGNSRALLGQGVDDRGAGRGQGSLEHVAQDAENAVEVLVLGSGSAVVGSSLPLDARHHLGQHHEVDDEGRSQERVLTDVEETGLVLAKGHAKNRGENHWVNSRDGLVSSEENLGVVLIQSALVISHGWHVLDDDTVVGVLALLVQDVVSLDHVVNDV
jgi:hypothetical protein